MAAGNGRADRFERHCWRPLPSEVDSEESAPAATPKSPATGKRAREEEVVRCSTV